MKTAVRLRVGKWILFLASIFTVAGLWIQSHFGGWEYRSVAADQESCWRLASSGGFLFWQTCDLRDSVAANVLDLNKPIGMPPGFAVGTNPDGERTLIHLRGFDVPFLQPSFFDAFRLFGTLGVENTRESRWAAHWHEYVLTYWLVLLLLLLSTIMGLIRRGYRRLRGSPAGTG